MSVAITGPRVAGSAAPQWIGIGFWLPGCDVSLMCLLLCLGELRQLLLDGSSTALQVGYGA